MLVFKAMVLDNDKGYIEEMIILKGRERTLIKSNAIRDVQ